MATLNSGNRFQAESHRDAEILRLKARLYDMHTENEGLRQDLASVRQELKDTRELLGRAVVQARIGKQRQNKIEAIPAHPQPKIEAVEVVQKRERSPSIEIIEAPMYWHGMNSTAENKPVSLVKNERSESPEILLVKAEPELQRPPCVESDIEDMTRRPRKRKLENLKDDPEPKPNALLSNATSDVKPPTPKRSVSATPKKPRRSVAQADLSQCMGEKRHSMLVDQPAERVAVPQLRKNAMEPSVPGMSFTEAGPSGPPKKRRRTTAQVAPNLPQHKAEKKDAMLVDEPIETAVAPQAHKKVEELQSKPAAMKKKQNEFTVAPPIHAEDLPVASSSSTISPALLEVNKPTQPEKAAKKTPKKVSGSSPSKMATPAIKPQSNKPTNSGNVSVTDNQSQRAAVASTSSAPAQPVVRKPRKSGKKNVMTLSESVAETYMGDSTPLAIDPPPMLVEVPRKFLRIAYGGSDQQFLQYIPEDRNPSGNYRRRIVFPTLALNPLMPSQPGMQGLVFASRREILDNGAWTLFCKRSNASPAVWCYVGEYENTLAGTMTAEEFSGQPCLVQREWAMQLLDCKQHDVYVSMRARIALRKTGALEGKPGAEMTEEDTDQVNNEVLAIKKGRGIPVNKGDIVEAFCKGDEAIDIIRMRCVSYDHAFAEDMKRLYPSSYPALIAADKKRQMEKLAKKNKKKADTPAPASEPDGGVEDDGDYANSDHEQSDEEHIEPSLRAGPSRRSGLRNSRAEPGAE